MRTLSAKNGKGAKEQNRPFRDATTAGEAAFLILDAQLARFLGYEEPVLKTDEPEAVHQMRVSARRMRAAFESFSVFLPKSLLALEADLEWIFHELGEIRDLDVEIKLVVDGGDEEDAPGPAAELAAWFQQNRKTAKQRLIKDLESERYAELKRKLKASIGKGPPASGLAPTPLLAVAPDLVIRQGTAVRDDGRKITLASPDADYHHLRRTAKKFRYTLDFFAELYGEDAARVTETLKVLQDVLGERQDTVVLEARLRGLLEKEALSAEASRFAKKFLEKLERREAHEEREFKDAFQPVFGKRWKALKQAMTQRRRDLWAQSR